MYTQCPYCSTIFDASDEELGALQGRVRCGRCREVFNAQWNLVGSVPAAGSDTPRAADFDTPQKWSVSALEDEDEQSLPTVRPGDTDEIVTELLIPTEVATTEELRHLGDSASVSPTPPREETAARDTLPQGRIEPELGVTREIDEEIVIEAPTNLWNLNDESDALDSETATVEGESGNSEATERSGPRLIPIARHADDVKLVQIPHPKPIQSAAWVAAALILVAAVFWQLKQYYIADLAEVASLREPLEMICEYASCTVPPRTNIKRIDLVSTSVDPHPDTPGALRVSANLINRAKFVQPFPPLEVTLTDREGVVVGRRTYLPHEYRSAPVGDMSPNVLERADLDLAQPEHSAVGYEIQLVAG